MVILEFPDRKSRKERRRADGAAAIAAFPSDRHARFVGNVAGTMARCGTIDAAERHLMKHLDFHWNRLEKLGVSEAAIEAECRAFARAAWLTYQQAMGHTGVA